MICNWFKCVFILYTGRMDFVWKWKSDTQSTDDAQNMRKELNPEKKEQTKSAPGEKAT